MKRIALPFIFFLLLFIGLPRWAGAQDGAGQFLKDTTKDLILDPTTYTPAGLSWLGKKLDWDSSQVFFRNGYIEANPDFTINGQPHDKPVTHSAGNRKIIELSLRVIPLSLLNNVGVSMSERNLIHFYPEHRKLIKTVHWIEKIAMASYLSYKYSQPNFSQWRTNKRLAGELGLK